LQESAACAVNVSVKARDIFGNKVQPITFPWPIFLLSKKVKKWEKLPPNQTSFDMFLTRTLHLLLRGEQSGHSAWHP